MGVMVDVPYVELALGVGLLLYLFYRYSTATFDYWEKRGVPFPKPLPLLGNSLKSILNLTTTDKSQTKLYNQYPEHRFVGFYALRTPMLFIRDPELVESILIKDFPHFYNRGLKTDPKLDPLSQHLVNLEDQKWKSLRNKLTPVFSSGKLKLMHQQLVDCSDLLIKYLDGQIKTGEPIEFREVLAKFTTDVIGSCAFGLHTNALENPDSEFRKMGKTVFMPSVKLRLRTILRTTYPRILKMLKWKGLPQHVEDFFVSVIRETVHERETKGIERNDFVQLLMNLRKQEKTTSQLINQDNSTTNGNAKLGDATPDGEELTFDDTLMAANAFVFFVAGFETTASTLSYCLYELSQHPEIQDKLFNEVTTVLKKHNGEATFEAVNEMMYLQQVINEAQRVHPPVPGLPRVVTIPYTIPGTNITLTKGSRISIPIYALHHDPKYWPEPEKFNPDRFSEENKHNIKKGTFLPFGDGPRICIGKRFAQTEMKVALAKLISQYRIFPSSKTRVPLKYQSTALLLAPKGGIWLHLEKRAQ